MKTKRRKGNPKMGEIGISTRFQPGVSGNPGGRPKTRVLSEMLAAIGNETESKSGKTYYQLAAEAFLGQAFDGNVHAFREFADRVEGRTTQRVELSGVERHPIAVAVKGAWEREWETASFERRQQVELELEDKILQHAEKIKARRNRPEHEKRYELRMREFRERCAAGEDPEEVLATMKTPPVGPIAVN